MAHHTRGTQFTTEETADGVGVVEKAPKHREVRGAVLGMCELGGGGLRVAVGDDDTPVVGDGASDQPVGVAVLQTVTVQVVAEDGVSSPAHEQRMPRGVGVVKVSGDRVRSSVAMNPPNRSLRSTRATDQPALASSAAATRPFTPEPTTMASNVRSMSSPLRSLLD
jgi:hypothetical protein